MSRRCGKGSSAVSRSAPTTTSTSTTSSRRSSFARSRGREPSARREVLLRGENSLAALAQFPLSAPEDLASRLRRSLFTTPIAERRQMFVGTLEVDVLLGDVHSLKEKRSIVRPIVAELRRRYDVSAAEVDHLDLHRRASVGVALVGADAAHCGEVLDACERFVAGRPEVELLSARRRLFGHDD